MREMKNSGIEWLGLYPSHWYLHKIKYCLRERIEKNSPVRTTDILSLTAKQGVVPYDQKEGGGNKPKEDVSAYRLAYPGDIVMNSMNILSGSVGLSSYFGCVSPVYYMLRPWNTTDDVRYYNYIFQSTLFQRSLYGLGNGILIKESGNGKLNTIRMRIPMDKFGGLFIPVTPSNEQKSIANYLDTKCAEIDALTADIQTQIDTLEQYKRSVITEAVTKGLNPDAEMKDSGVQWIGNIPSHWKCIRGKYILNYIQKPIKEDDGVITCFRDGEVTLRSNRREDGFTMADKEIGYQGIDIGDLVVHGMDGFAGAIGISDSRGKASPVLNVLETEQNKRYIMYFLRSMAYSDVFLALATGIRVRSCDLRWNKLAELIYPVPTLEEQNSIVEYIDSVIQKTDIIINEKQEQLETLESYKKSLIYEYVTGKKEVPAAESDVIAVIFDPELVQAYIAHKLGKDNEKGKVYSHKVKYMVDYHIGLGLNIAYTRNYRGPHDVNLDTYIDSIISKGWYRKQKKDGAEILVKGKNYTDFINNHSDIFNQYESDIDNLIKYLKTLTRGQIERIATLYAVWNDFIIDGKTNPTEEEIITEVVTNWTKNKANFQHTTWQESLNQMKQHGIIPKGQ